MHIHRKCAHSKVPTDSFTSTSAIQSHWGWLRDAKEVQKIYLKLFFPIRKSVLSSDFALFPHFCHFQDIPPPALSPTSNIHNHPFIIISWMQKTSSKVLRRKRKQWQQQQWRKSTENWNEKISRCSEMNGMKMKKKKCSMKCWTRSRRKLFIFMLFMLCQSHSIVHLISARPFFSCWRFTRLSRRMREWW